MLKIPVGANVKRVIARLKCGEIRNLRKQFATLELGHLAIALGFPEELNLFRIESRGG
jgi:hypothetical protein